MAQQSPQPLQDPMLGDVDLNSFEGPDPRDPRSQGRGWCEEECHAPKPWQSNKYAVWRKCGVCGLRLRYYAKRGSGGEYRMSNPLADNVLRAFELAELSGEEVHTDRTFQLYLKVALAEKKTARRRNRGSPVGGAVGAAGAVGATGAVPLAKQSRRTSACVRWARAALHLIVRIHEATIGLLLF